jgi:hypothetical protein
MGRIIPLQDRHQEAQELLPWYVTGTLDAADRAMVEAHLTDCSECQAELALERRLRAEVAAMPLDAELGWAAFRHRLEADAKLATPPLPPRRSSRLPTIAVAMRRAFAKSGRTGWIVAAQAAALVLVATMVIPSFNTPAPYRTLSAAPTAASTTGNVIVMFRPNTPEQDMRRTLVESGARLVDGPTEANAYILAVPAPQRTAALAKLRARTDILMAEPIDPGAHP